MNLLFNPHFRNNEKGLSLLEVALTIGILAILAGMALPLARVSIRRAKEIELRQNLRTIRKAIDEYHKYAQQGLIIQTDVEQDFYPPDLETLVEGVELAGDPTGKKLRFLRRIPRDPMTGDTEWGMRSTFDDFDSTSWGGENVWDVYSQADALSLDGKMRYNEW